MRPLSVKPLLWQIRQLLETEAESHKIHWEIAVTPEDLRIQGDEGLLKTACLNITLNAIQAMPHGGRLDIRATMHESNGTAMCALTFADTGGGIPEEERAKIFQPYFTTKKDGTGLGLSIVNRVIEDHRGTIRVESTVGAGTTMTVLLPLSDISF